MKNKNKDIFKYIEEYFNDYLVEEIDASEKTMKNYKQTFKLLFKFIDEKCGFSVSNFNFDKFTKKFVLDFLNWLESDRKNSISSRNTRLATIKSFSAYTFMFEVNNRELYLIMKIKPKRVVDSKVKALSKTQINLLLSNINLSNKRGRRHGAMFYLLYDAALRIDELLSLKCEDINIKKNEIQINNAKFNKQRTVPINRSTMNIVVSYLNDCKLTTKDKHYLFHNSKQEKLTSNTIRKILQKYVDIAKNHDPSFPKIHLHQFRHSKATHLIEKNVNVVEVKEFLGHANLSSTQVYVTSNIENKRKAMETIESQVVAVEQSIDDDEVKTWLENLGYKKQKQ